MQAKQRALDAWRVHDKSLSNQGCASGKMALQNRQQYEGKKKGHLK